jgi:hypothetical protein
MFIRLRGKVKKDSAQEHESSRANGIKHVFNTDISGQLFSVVVTSKLTRG